MIQFIRVVIVFLAIMLALAPNGQAAQLLDKLQVNEKLVALVIEDIETQEDLNKVVALSGQWEAKMTFFISADIIQKQQLSIRQAIALGHEFGNHGMSHSYWGEVAASQIQDELAQAGAVLFAETGRSIGLFKPPYYYYEANYVETVQKVSPQGLIVRGEDLSDWTLMSAEAVLERAVAAADKGAIIQLNYKMKQAADALPGILEKLSKLGFRLVTVSELQAKALPQAPKPAPLAKLPAKLDFYGALNHITGSPPSIALTFDDSGTTPQVQSILDILKKHHAQATFFVVGSWVNDHPDLVKRMAAEGHEIANHSYSHANMTWLNDTEIKQEIETTQTAIAEASGKAAAPFFRPPYGSYNSRVIRVVKEMGYQALVMWDIDTRDWSGIYGSAISNHVLERVYPGSIVLFHLHGSHTLAALDELLPALKQQGYQLRTVGQMLNA